MSMLEYTWTPLLNASPAPLCRSDFQPLCLRTENLDMPWGQWRKSKLRSWDWLGTSDSEDGLKESSSMRSLRPCSWVLALLTNFCGNCLWTTKEVKGVWGPSQPRQTGCLSKVAWVPSYRPCKGESNPFSHWFFFPNSFAFSFPRTINWLFSVFSGPLGRQQSLISEHT